MTCPEFGNVRPARWAFSLVELLVVIGTVGILAGLMLAGVQKALATAAQTNCQNNLRQIGVGMHLFHDAHNSLPSSGGYIDTGSGTPLGWSNRGANIVHFGRPDPSQPPKQQLGSWPYSILPFLEYENVYQRVDYAFSTSLFHCQARRSPAPQVCPAADPVNHGVTYSFDGINPWTKTDYSANGVVIQCYPRPMKQFSQITKGLAETILVGEKSMDPRNYLTGGWFWDEPALIGCNARTGSSIFRDRVNVPFPNNWGSVHDGAAQFLFCDGSVRGLAYGTNSRVIQRLVQPNWPISSRR